ncbi:MAG: 30S ribosomal protein S8 [Actinobacteria bacterium]|jgi:small subunit ribosomal protein S8|nr:30S ribosomal protein S8 [Actinomycetota bacterium]NBR67018.1 30S ribosomal protein S8 [Actinomycetota bacterium]NBU17216.1 30S ribosomal protein S8 [Actinomycetota bacterium]
MMTDPIADMLTRIRNANTALKETVVMPSSKQKVALAEILKKEGYIADYSVAPAASGPGNSLTIQMKYSDDRHRTISGLTRVSTPGLRVYRNSAAVPRVLGGLGVAVLSTSQGLMTDREARKRKVGGEVLCFVW